MTARAAHVFDLDGVVRDFGPGDVAPSIESALGLPAGHLAATAFRPDLVEPTITGRASFAQWYAAICDALAADLPDGAPVHDQMERWRAHRGTPVASTVARIETLRQAGRRTYLFTNGTDHVPAELRQLGLDHLFDGVLNSAELGVAKPDPAAFAAAHRVIETDLGRSVGPAEVWFTDDRPDNVVAATTFG
ncbi:MAG: HAD family hydrolase [Terracoccus sp.]